MMRAGPTGMVDAELSRWVRESVHETDISLHQIAGGNSRGMWTVSVNGRRNPQRWVVRNQPDSVGSGPYSLTWEAQIYAGLNLIDSTVPKLRAVRDDGTALVIDFVPGRSDIRSLTPAQRTETVSAYLTSLGAIHGVSLRRMGLEHLLAADGDSPDIAGCVRSELLRWESIMRRSSAGADPLLEFGLDWLRANIPESTSQPTLVHGDAGPGNFLFDSTGITGIIDWELAHAGDPMEDLAWVTLRGAFDHVPDLTEIITRHCHDVGVDPDRHRLRYFQALALWKVMVIRHRAIGDPGRNLGRNVYYRLIHRRMFIQVMSDILHVPVPHFEPPTVPDTERTWLYEACVANLKGLAEEADAPETAGLVNLIRVLRYLKLWDAGSSWVANHETELGQKPGGEDVFRALAARVVAEHVLCRPLLRGEGDLQLVGFAGGTDSV